MSSFSALSGTTNTTNNTSALVTTGDDDCVSFFCNKLCLDVGKWMRNLDTSYDLIEASSSSVENQTLERRAPSASSPSSGWPYRRIMPSFQTAASPAFNVLLGHTVNTMNVAQHTHHNHNHNHHHHSESPSSSHKIVNFFSRPFRSNPLKRTKSVSKLDRIKRSALDADCHGWSHCPATTSNTADLYNFSSPGHQRCYNNGRQPYCGYINGSNNGNSIRNSRSHESLLTYSTTTHAIDLSANGCTVTPLHSSVLGAPHCFQIRTNTGATKYYACRTSGERNRWLESLRSMQPNHDQIKRQENSLQLWIFAAKGIQCKRRYYCELCLDKTLYCRTTSKLKSTDECFWGEQFEINHLPKLETLCINLYREADRKKRKDRNTLIGFVQIPVALLVVRHPIEKWYMIAGGEKPNKNESPSVRIKARYQTVTILPLRIYDGFLQFIKRDYLLLCSAVEHLTSVKSKEDIATCLVHVLHKLRLAKDFLCDLVMAEVESLDNYHLMFRGNSLATKAMEAYMKLVGDQYLHDTMSEFIQSVIDSDEECEVDPNKFANFMLLDKHRDTLTRQVHLAWGKIVNSFYEFPAELRLVFYELRNRLNKCGRSDLADYLISSNIFLRFLCPAILSPNLFNLIQEYPNEKTVRNLTLIAKTVQTLANFTRFGVKEQYMEFMNKFVEGELEHMRQYLARISSAPTQDYINKCLEWEGFVDLGKELSLLHSYLMESWQQIEPSLGPKSTELRRILDYLTECLENLSKTPLYSTPMTETPTSPISDYENNISSGCYSNVSNQSKSNESSPKSRSSGELTPHFKLPRSSNSHSLNNGSNYNIRNGCTLIGEEDKERSINKMDDEDGNGGSRFYFPISPDHNSGESPTSGLGSGSGSGSGSGTAAISGRKRNTAASNLHTNDDYVWRTAIDENMGLRRTGVVVQQNRLRCNNGDAQVVRNGHSSLSPEVTAASAVVGASTDGFTFADDHLYQQQQNPQILAHCGTGGVMDGINGGGPFPDSDNIQNLRGSRGSLTTTYTQTASSSGYQSLNYSTSNSSSPVDTITSESLEKKSTSGKHGPVVTKNTPKKDQSVSTFDSQDVKSHFGPPFLNGNNNSNALSISNPLYCMQTVPLIKQKSSTCYSLPDIQRHLEESTNHVVSSTNSFPITYLSNGGEKLSNNSIIGNNIQNRKHTMDSLEDDQARNRYSIAASDRRRLYQRAKTVLTPTNSENLHRVTKNVDDFQISGSASLSAAKTSPAPRTNPRYARSHSQNTPANGSSSGLKHHKSDCSEFYQDENVNDSGHLVDHYEAKTNIYGGFEETRRKSECIHHKLARSDKDQDKLQKTRSTSETKTKWTEQVKPILNRLKVVEFELQEEINASTRKEKIIEAQRKRIEQLQCKNENLLSTLNDLKQQRSRSLTGDDSPKMLVIPGHVTESGSHVTLTNYHHLSTPSTISSSSMSTDSILSVVQNDPQNSNDDPDLRSPTFSTPPEKLGDVPLSMSPNKNSSPSHFNQYPSFNNSNDVTKCSILLSPSSSKDGNQCDNELSPDCSDKDFSDNSLSAAKLDFSGLKTTEC